MIDEVLTLVASQLGAKGFKLVGYEVLAGGSSEKQVALNNVQADLSPQDLTGRRRSNLSFDITCQLGVGAIRGLSEELRAAAIARDITNAIAELRKNPILKDAYTTQQAYFPLEKLLTISVRMIYV